MIISTTSRQKREKMDKLTPISMNASIHIENDCIEISSHGNSDVKGRLNHEENHSNQSASDDNNEIRSKMYHDPMFTLRANQVRYSKDSDK